MRRRWVPAHGIAYSIELVHNVFVLGEYRITGRRASDIAGERRARGGLGRAGAGATAAADAGVGGQLGVNPNTVAAAYRTLRERGVIETAGRRGSRVRSRPATTRTRDASGSRCRPAYATCPTATPTPHCCPPLAEAFAAAAAQRSDRAPVLYGEAAVDPELARLARAGPRRGRRARRARSSSPPARSTPSSGCSPPTCGPATRSPSRTPAGAACSTSSRRSGCGSVAGRRRRRGAGHRRRWRRALGAGARALVVTDRAQNPTGAAVSAPRARALRAVLADHPGVLVIDDDHGHGLVDLPLHPLAGVTQHWALVRSAAKAYGPDLRLAVLHRRRGHRRPGPRAAAARPRLGQPPAATRGRPPVDQRRGGPGRPWRARTSGAATRCSGARGERGVAAHGRSGMNVWVPVPDETGAVARLLHARLGGRARGPLPGERAARSCGSPSRRSRPPTSARWPDAVAAAVGPARARRYG